MGGSNLPRLRVLAAWAIAWGVWATAPAATVAAEPAGVAGRVLTDARPVSEATVYAYQMVERTLRSVLTDGAGQFRFADLPAGLYKIIAHKSGFAPAVLVVTRRAADDHQFVQVELPASAEEPAGDGYWELRSEVPGDVLRELDGPPTVAVFALAPAVPDLVPTFLTQVAAETSVGDLQTDARAQLVAGEVGLEGRLGRMRVAVDGDFRTLASDAVSAGPAATTVEGEAAALRVRLEAPSSGRFDLATESERLLTVVGGGEIPVGFERFQLNYHRDFADEGSTAVFAQYLDETGMYADRRLHPVELPRASRVLRIEGNYARPLGDDVRLRSGLRFRESVRDYATETLDARSAVEARTFDAWSFADWTVDSTYVVQYGLFTTARDGSVSVAPRGGLLVRFRPEWEASISASRRLEVSASDPLLPGEFTPATLRSALGCADAEASCYELQVLHGHGDADHVRVGGSWREFDRTVRLFLEDDTFDGEGLFLVPGDRLPEYHATVRRQLGPKFVAHWTSSFAEGGGGTFQAANRRLYENDVRYLSSAFETTFQPTSTGIYVAFHRVEQRLDAVRRQPARRSTTTASELETYEVAVSQDLSTLFDVPTDWAVRVGFELLRGGTLFQSVPVDSEEYRHRVTTGVAVRF